MKKLSLFAVILCLSLVTVLVLSGIDETTAGSHNSIEGTYLLVSRDLPDGSVVKPPHIGGMMTYTKEYRNFNVMWKEGGKIASLSCVASYRLSGGYYSETNIYYVANNEIEGTGLSYDFSGQSGKSEVTMSDDKMSFQMPLHNEPRVEFSADGFSATVEGVFVDHWVRVN